ncbi:MAG: restriction endonuclease [Pyrinomonadaceae bacterium]
MNTVSEFIVGERYTNDQIRYTLNLENLGGIRPSIGTNGKLQHLALMTATETSGKRKGENPYHDRIEGNVLVYTGTGRKGNHQLTGKNKRLTEQIERPLPFYGFINEGRQVYRFLGLLQLIRFYEEQQIDIAREMRTAWVFEFLIHKSPEVIPIEFASSIAEQLITESRRVNPTLETEREVVTALKPDESESVQQIFAAEELRSRLLEINPYKFEHLVRDVVAVSGFRDVEVTRASGDGGIDVVGYVANNNDFFGGTYVQFQAKRWRHTVGSVEINNFRGAMSATAKGIFITTSHYTKAAHNDARNPMKPCISLIDGRRFCSLLIESGIAVNNYFEE